MPVSGVKKGVVLRRLARVLLARQGHPAPLDDRSILDHEAGLGEVSAAWTGPLAWSLGQLEGGGDEPALDARLLQRGAAWERVVEEAGVLFGLDVVGEPVLGDGRDREELGCGFDVATP